ncbi:MAG: DsbC family protein [Altererythrobacter sp.]|nr:DsbC family protein [Altererythrobacter sp.]
MNYLCHRPGLKARAATIALAMTSAATVLTLGVAAVVGMPASAASQRDVAAALKLRLPNTPVDQLTCDGIGPLCEVVSGGTLFYVDKTARFLLVGRPYDMETRRDVTAARLREINPDLIAAGGVRAAGEPGQNEAAEPNAAPEKVDLSSLPAEGAVRWGNPAGPKLVVFSDFQCGYCRRLAGELTKAGVAVEERPISIFGAPSRALAEKVLCARDPAKALHQAYAGGEPAARKGCAASGLDANEAFARRHGFAGTPVLVRASDGAVLHGYRDAAAIRRFVEAAPTEGGR